MDTPFLNELERTTHSPEETLAVGARIGGAAQRGDCIALAGPLGAGKTVVVKGIARGLGVSPDQVTSPTFVLEAIHEGRLILHHFDAYRLTDSSELLEIGAEEAIHGSDVSVVEWADRVPEILPEDRLEIHVELTGERERRLRLRATGPQSAWLLRAAKA